MKKIIVGAALMVLMLSGCQGHAQKYCQQVTAEFSDADAPEELKKLTLERLIQNVKNKKQQADITLENGVIVAKIPCEGVSPSTYFRSGKFAIYETYDAAGLANALAGMASISEDMGIPFEQLVDTHFAYGASIGTCLIMRMEQFQALVNHPEIKKLLPDGLTFAFGIPEKGAKSVPVFAVKIVKDAPITINMMKDASITESRNGMSYDVNLEFKKEYKKAWEELTQKNTNKCLAIMLGDEVLSCPMLMAPIANGKATIAANMDKQQAGEMAQRINFSLPLEVLITEVKMLD